MCLNLSFFEIVETIDLVEVITQMHLYTWICILKHSTRERAWDLDGIVKKDHPCTGITEVQKNKSVRRVTAKDKS